MMLSPKTSLGYHVVPHPFRNTSSAPFGHMLLCHDRGQTLPVVPEEAKPVWWQTYCVVYSLKTEENGPGC